MLASAGFTDPKKLSLDFTPCERSAMVAIVLSSLSVMAMFWDRTLGVIQVTPRRKVRTQWYYPWAQLGAVVVLASQIATLLDMSSSSDFKYVITALVHAAYLTAFITGKTVHGNPEITLKHSGAPLKTSDEIPNGDRGKVRTLK